MPPIPPAPPTPTLFQGGMGSRGPNGLAPVNTAAAVAMQEIAQKLFGRMPQNEEEHMLVLNTLFENPAYRQSQGLGGSGIPLDSPIGEFQPQMDPKNIALLQSLSQKPR